MNDVDVEMMNQDCRLLLFEHFMMFKLRRPDEINAAEFHKYKFQIQHFDDINSA